MTWFIQHRRCIGPHVDAMYVCLELMLQPLPRLIPFFEDSYSLHLSSLSLVYQVFSWILQLPTGELASEFVLHPFLRHILATWPSHHNLLSRIAFTRSVCPVLFRISSFVTLSLQVIPRMPLIHLWRAASNFLLNVTARGHSSALYRVGQFKWHHFTFLLVTNACINKILWFLAQINYIKQQTRWC